MNTRSDTTHVISAPPDAAHPLFASPTATTASTSVSHASSPAMNGMVPAYALGSSSLATALDGARSRSGSAASPGHLSSASEVAFAQGAAIDAASASAFAQGEVRVKEGMACAARAMSVRRNSCGHWF